MKKFLMMLMLVLSTSTLLMADFAEAKRVGGGRSIGRQNNTVQQAAPPAQNAATARQQQAAAAQQPGRRSGMMGLLGGLAAGLGLAALASAFGLGEGFAIFLLMLLLGVAALVAIRMFMARKQAQGQPQAAGAGAAGGAFSGNNLRDAFNANRQATPDLAGGAAPVGAAGAAAAGAATAAAGAAGYTAAMDVPAGFDTEAFVRQAKVQFVRLQAAFDTKNSDDLREFTSPEMFGELNVELMQRGDATQTTDVVELDAQLLGVHTDGAMQVASVMFSGLIREQADSPAEDFREVWNFSRPASGASGWVLAGIQQLN